MHSIGGSSSQHLSWRSAFFGISGLALNTMFQEGGSFEDIPELLRYVIRSSPIACAADIILTVCRFIDVLRDHSLIDALRVVAILRYPEDPQHQSNGLLGVQVKSAIVFGTACLQLLKLMACKGIPWTQAAALMYMALNLIDGSLRRVFSSTPAETLVMLRHGDYNKRRWHRIQSCISVICVLLQFLFWMYISIQALPKRMETWDTDSAEERDSPYKNPSRVVLVFLVQVPLVIAEVSVTLICIIGMADMLWNKGFADLPSLRSTLPNFLQHRLTPSQRSWYLIIPVSLLAFILYITIIFFAVRSNYLHRTTFAIMFITSGFSSTWMLLRWFLLPLLSLVFTPNLSRKAADEACMHLALLIIHVAITLTYYKLVYDPKNTFKPKWTDWLG
jgi:hypothetical protein